MRNRPLAIALALAMASCVSPSLRAQNNKPNEKKPAPKTIDELIAHCVGWLNAERDDEKVKARWSGADEKQLRAHICAGRPDAFARAKSKLDQRLKDGKCPLDQDDEIPF